MEHGKPIQCILYALCLYGNITAPFQRVFAGAVGANRVGSGSGRADETDASDRRGGWVGPAFYCGTGGTGSHFARGSAGGETVPGSEFTSWFRCRGGFIEHCFST